MDYGIPWKKVMVLSYSLLSLVRGFIVKGARFKAGLEAPSKGNHKGSFNLNLKTEPKCFAQEPQVLRLNCSLFTL